MQASIGIVGASLAGLHAGLALRRGGFDGRLVIIGDELEKPYDRPPLSKEFVRGEWDRDKIALAYDTGKLSAEWRLGHRAVHLDVEQRLVDLENGEQLRFDGIVIATGARPKRLPGLSLPGVHVLRAVGDAMGLRDSLARHPTRIVIIGAGFIGQEVAASCRRQGLAVTMVEATAPAQHVLGAEVARIIGDVHLSEGVDLRLGVAVTAIEGDGPVQQVQLSDGAALPADLVVLGIGVTPNTEWLADSSLTIDNGVVCDDTCLAAPGIVAAGDVARWPNRRYGELRRVEHWDNAIRQADHAARRLLAVEGSPAAALRYEPVPWFWSDQYGLKLQLVGSTVAHDEARIVHGTTASRKFVALYRRNDRLVAAFGMNSAGRILKYRQLLDGNPKWDAALAMLQAA